ncbi:hypothetical protein LJC42_00930 [Eubacteriales bacterium OttesenSCG-928-K08]|nr:hypothetical protein [Eubacteriales bacterium OttesenSCG-928-K08]
MLILCILLLLIFLALLLLLWPARLKIKCDANLFLDVRADFCAGFLSGLVHYTYRVRMNILKEPVLTLWRYKKNETKLLFKAGAQKEQSRETVQFPLERIWNHLRLKKLSISGEVGIKEDAFVTVMLTGAISSLLNAGLFVLCREKDQSAISINITPDFKADSFRLNLEGIASCAPIHIIIAIVLWEIENRKGKKAVWRILSKTS